ncbi:MAG TPA: nucleotide modification associated domain-containing protein, partial [Marinilabiliaceae bacterium]|nr:nucleotide modification associated domain-containing protein [Marinilabiliaceae bacterium]
EFIGIVNYASMALIQLELGVSDKPEMPYQQALELFLQKLNISKELMQNKNHDYDEAWRVMRISSLTDLILMKLYRVKQIEDQNGKTLISEGVDANYMDIINYAVFALIKLDFPEQAEESKQ